MADLLHRVSWGADSPIPVAPWWTIKLDVHHANEVVEIDKVSGMDSDQRYQKQPAKWAIVGVEHEETSSCSYQTKTCRNHFVV